MWTRLGMECVNAFRVEYGHIRRSEWNWSRNRIEVVR